MRIGITGGTGFLGGLLTARLLSERHEVVVFTRSPDRTRARIPGGAVPVAWDPLSPMPPSHLDALDAVVTLTGLSAFGVWSPARKLEMVQSRVTAVRNLMLGWSRAATPPAVLVSGSAVGYYGDGGDAELTEGAPNGHGFMADLCRDWEAEARAGLTLGARVVQLRTGIPLHPAGGALRVMLPPFRLGLGAVIGNGRQWFPWIHIQDWLALAVFCLTTDGVAGPVNGTAPNPVTNRAFTRTLAGVLGRPAFLRVPAFLLRAAARELADEMALISQRAVPAQALEQGFGFRFPELEGALRDLLG